MFDEINNECWYSFIFEPEPYLKKVKQKNIEEQLSFVSNDPTLESFHEVDKETNEFIKVSAYFNKFLTKLFNLVKQCGQHYVFIPCLKKTKSFLNVGDAKITKLSS